MRRCPERLYISIHAPVKGATQKKMRKAVSNLFQSTLPRRERRGRHDHQRRGGLISIHAPAKGATVRTCRRNGRTVHFNPRSREGSDLKISRSPPTLGFQSTLPRRERRRQMIMVTLTVPFQSTLPRRERRSQNELISMRMEFQSTLPRRERRGKSGGNPRHRLHFNPRSREGSDGGPAPVLARGLTFQSTLPRREPPAYP